MFKIGEFSRLAQVPVKTLRYYDEVGLLKPAQVDRFTEYRYYTADQLAQLNRILAFKDLGFSLDEIRQLLNERIPPEQLRGMLRLKRAEIRERVDEEQARLGRVEARLRLIEQENQLPDVEVVVKKLPTIRAAALRAIVPTYGDQGILWGELSTHLAQQRNVPSGAAFTVYYDTEYREQDVDVQVCQPVSSGIMGNGRIEVIDLPVVTKVAATLHRGGFENVNETYAALMQWIVTNGFRVAGQNREVYLRTVVSPDVLEQLGVGTANDYLTTNEAERLTEIQFPIEKG